MEVKLGWRKLSAWLLIFLLCAAVTIKAVWDGRATDIPSGVQNVLIWVTSAFFVLNAVADHKALTPGAGNGPKTD